MSDHSLGKVFDTTLGHLGGSDGWNHVSPLRLSNFSVHGLALIQGIQRQLMKNTFI